MEIMLIVLIIALGAHQLASKSMTHHNEVINPMRGGAKAVLFIDISPALSTVPTHRNYSINSY